MSGGLGDGPAAVTISSAGIKREAAAAGFDLCGIAAATDHVELRYFREWLEHGYAGGMEYLRRTADRRADVRHVLPSARSVISLGTVYNTAHPYSADSLDADRAAIARYAWGDDYHGVIQGRLDVLLERLRSTYGDGFEARAYVDTGPVQERVYAQYAGLGWIGKNTCLINPELGSWIFLSEIICNLDLEPDEAVFDQCGTCTLCLAACPTGALVEPGVLDSTRCLSYLTIENKDEIREEQRVLLGSHAYGCDICQDVCPYNNTATTAVSSDQAWQPREGLALATPARHLAADRRRAPGASQGQRDEARWRPPAATQPGGRDRQQPQSGRRPGSSKATTSRCAGIRWSRNTSRGPLDGWPSRREMTNRRKASPADPKPGEPVSELLPERPTLATVREIAAGCKACDLYERGTQTVFGEGPRKAEMMLVGEQPGDAEDLPAIPSSARRASARRRARRGRRRPASGLRHQRRKALQVGAARQAAHPRQAQRGRDRRLSSLAGSRDRAGEAARADLPRRHRRPGAARQVVQGVAPARYAGRHLRWLRS